MALYNPTTNPVLRYTGNGSLKDYDITFSFADTEDLSVYLNDAPQSEGTHYDIQGTQEDHDNGLSVLKFKTAPQDGALIAIIRYTNIDRVTDFATAARFTPDLFDSEFNQSRRIEQENRNILNNSVHAPITQSGKFNGEVQNFVPSGVLQVNQDGDGIQTLQLEETQAYKDMVSLRGEAEVIKDQTQGIHDQTVTDATAIKNQATQELNQIKTDTLTEYNQIKTDTITETTQIKDAAISVTNQDKLDAQTAANDALAAERRISGISATITNRSIPWDYTAKGGETSLNPGRQFNTAQVMINGITQTPGKAYDILNNRIALAEALEEGDEVFALIGDYIKPSDQSLTANEIPDIKFSVGGTTERSMRERFGDVINVRNFGAKGDGITDDTDAIQKALNEAGKTGKKYLFIPAGVYLCTKTIRMPSNFAGGTIQGVGAKHPQSASGTELRSKDGTFEAILETVDGCNGIVIDSITFNGNKVGRKGVKVTGGAIQYYNNCEFNNFKEYGFDGYQGLTHFSNCRSDGNTGYGVAVYSDSSIFNCEFTGGSIPLWIRAGGCRVVNLWANSAKDTNVLIKPLNNSTNHINTSLTNLYVGEVSSTDGSVIRIEATGSRKPRQIQISNSHVVIAAADQKTKGIKVDGAEDVVISNIAFLGFQTYFSDKKITDAFIHIANTSGLTVSNCILNGATRNAVYIGANNLDVQFSNCIFKDWGYDVSDTAYNSAFYVEDSGDAFLNIVDCVFRIQHATRTAGVVSLPRGARLLTTGCRISVPSPTPFIARDSGQISGSYYSNNTLIDFIRDKYKAKGSFSLAGGLTKTFANIPVVSESRTYQVVVRQQGSGANATESLIFSFNTLTGALIARNTSDNTALKNSITTSGANLIFTTGSGYGVTTWDYTVEEA